MVAFLEPSKIKTMQKIVLDLYNISLKNGTKCEIKCGRQNYDFEEGILVCLGPGQTIEPINPSIINKLNGWTLVFHLDLIHRTSLREKINKYSFFL